MAFLPDDDEERKRRGLLPSRLPVLLNDPLPPDMGLPTPANTSFDGPARVPGNTPSTMPGLRRPSGPNIDPSEADLGNYTAPGLPNLGSLSNRPPALPVSTAPTDNASLPALDPSLRGVATDPNASRYDQLNQAKDVYLQGTPGRGKSALLGALRGALSGLATGNLAGVAGGALAGATAGGINPRGLRTVQFNQQVRPQILERFGYEDQDLAQRQAAQKAAADRAVQAANINKINSEVNKPIVVGRGGSAIDPRTGQPVFTSPDTQQPKFGSAAPGSNIYNQNTGQITAAVPGKPTPPKAPTAAESSIDPDSGMSVEEMARASYEGRGGDDYVYKKLPENVRKVLEDDGTIYKPGEIMAAQRQFDSAKNRQWQADLSYTRGAIRTKVLGGKRGGNAKPMNSQSTANLKDLEQFWK